METNPVLRNRLRLRQLSLALAIDQEGTIHRAAGKLGMTQPAATRSLNELESLLRVQLFLRSRQGMIATDAGKMFVRHAAIVLNAVERAQSELSFMQAGVSGTLRVGQFLSAPPSLLATAVLHIKRAYPKLQVRILEGSQESMIAAVSRGELHLAIGRAPTSDISSSLNFEVLFNEHFSVVSSTKNRKRKRLTGEGMASLVDEPWILPLPSTPLRASLDLHFLASCGRMPSNTIEYTAYAGTALLRLLSKGDYVALLPSHIAAEHAELKLIHILLREVPDLVGPIGIITRQGIPLPPAGKRLVEALREQANSKGLTYKLDG